MRNYLGKHLTRLLRQRLSKRVLGFYALQKILDPADRLLSIILAKLKPFPQPAEIFYPPVFIIGLPRSGSTLLYQYLSLVLQVTYISNAWALLPRSGAYVFPGHTLPPADFQSFYGNSGYLLGPQEGGSIFAQWFRQNEHHFVDDLPIDLKQRMRAYFETVSATGQRPWLIKNSPNAIRIQALKAVFPEARYIRLRRDLLLIAQSIIEGRIRLTGDPHKNFTVRPKEWNMIKSLPYPRQVARQIHYIEAQIEQDLSTIPAEHVLTYNYHDFCQSPFEFVNAICDEFPFIRQKPDITFELKEITFKAAVNLRLEANILSQITDELANMTNTNEVNN
ncbi:sulfotransferase [Chloroflexota bacterium]